MMLISFQQLFYYAIYCTHTSLVSIANNIFVDEIIIIYLVQSAFASWEKCRKNKGVIFVSHEWTIWCFIWSSTFVGMTSFLLHAIYMLLLFVKSCDLRPHLKMIEYFLLLLTRLEVLLDVYGWYKMKVSLYILYLQNKSRRSLWLLCCCRNFYWLLGYIEKHHLLAFSSWQL